MPVITFKYQDLKDLGIDMEKDELEIKVINCKYNLGISDDGVNSPYL